MPSDSLADLTVREFLEKLRSSAPTPGGGAAAALVGALAAALGQMAAALTLGNARFASNEQQVRALAQRLQRTEALLTRLMDEDAAAYGELAGAFRIPKTDAARGARIAAAADVAAAVPLETAVIAQQAHAALHELANVSNPNLAADVQAGQHLARAAVAAALANVRVNLPFVTPQRVEALQRELAALERAGESPHAAALCSATGKLEDAE